MVGLLDVVPPSRKILLPTAEGDREVDVCGLTLPDLILLIARFPDLVAMVGKEMNIGLLIANGPDVVSAVIAAACGNAGDAKAEKIASTFPAGTVAEILSIVLELTMPEGPGPFVKLLKAAGLAEPARLLEEMLSAAKAPKPLNSSLPTDTSSQT